MNHRDLAAELIKIAGYLTKLAGEDGDLTPYSSSHGDDYVPYDLDRIQH